MGPLLSHPGSQHVGSWAQLWAVPSEQAALRGSCPLPLPYRLLAESSSLEPVLPTPAFLCKQRHLVSVEHGQLWHNFFSVRQQRFVHQKLRRFIISNVVSHLHCRMLCCWIPQPESHGQSLLHCSKLPQALRMRCRESNLTSLLMWTMQAGLEETAADSGQSAQPDLAGARPQLLLRRRRLAPAPCGAGRSGAVTTVFSKATSGQAALMQLHPSRGSKPCQHIRLGRSPI